MERAAGRGVGSTPWPGQAGFVYRDFSGREDRALECGAQLTSHTGGFPRTICPVTLTRKNSQIRSHTSLCPAPRPTSNRVRCLLVSQPFPQAAHCRLLSTERVCLRLVSSSSSPALEPRAVKPPAFLRRSRGGASTRCLPCLPDAERENVASRGQKPSGTSKPKGHVVVTNAPPEACLEPNQRAGSRGRFQMARAGQDRSVAFSGVQCRTPAWPFPLHPAGQGRLWV